MGDGWMVLDLSTCAKVQELGIASDFFFFFFSLPLIAMHLLLIVICKVCQYVMEAVASRSRIAHDELC
jgi:hypothetical protein